MAFILALLPIILILILMISFHWSAARAGATGYMLGVLIATTAFGANLHLLLFAHLRAAVLALDVLLIIWAAFLFYKITDEAGSTRLIGKVLPFLTQDKLLQALIIGWIFASFLQGVGGFGVPVAITAPILSGLGFEPALAVLIPCLGHGWAVTFGSLGTSFKALMATTGMSAAQLAPATGLLLGISCLYCGIACTHLAGGWRSVWKLAGFILSAGLLMAGSQWIIAVAGLWNVASFSGGLIGLAFVAIFIRSKQDRNGSSLDVDKKSLILAISGYLILVLVILVVQLVPPINLFLSQVSIHFPLPEIKTNTGWLGLPVHVRAAGSTGAIRIFSHPGMTLIYASVIVFCLYSFAKLFPDHSARRILAGTFSGVLPSTLSVVAMVAMSTIMEDAGMTQVIAVTLAGNLNQIFPWISPIVGGIGAFITGSNTNSNVLFAALQLKTAILLGLPATIILASQTTGAALASVAAPAKVVVGTSTVGFAGKEGMIIKRLIPYVAIEILLTGLFTTLGIALFR